MIAPDAAAMVKKLREQRPVLLACEAIGWLHMTGKAHPDFLRSQGGAGVRYEPKDWHAAVSPDWNSRLGWARSVGGALQWPSTFTDFLARFDDGPSQTSLVGLLQAGHAMASGIEKNLPAATSQYLGQDAVHMWLASPFGQPVRNLLADPPPVLRPGGWEALLDRIGRLLDELARLGGTPPTDTDPWRTWRNDAIGPNGWLREAFGSTLAETRLPNNDVTLWDQSYVAAALFKAAVAGSVLAGTSNWQNVKSQTRWRVLTVGFGARHYEARAVRIGDWTGARRDIDAFFDDVRRLVEVDLALGTLVYRDDEALAFTFPGLRADAAASDAKGSLDEPSAQALVAEIRAQVDARARKLDLETPPVCQLSTSTRSFIGLVKELREAGADLALPLHRAWEVSASEQTGHVCPVCLVRFNGDARAPLTDNAKKQRVCRVCAKRRRGRLDAWISGEGDTIWVSEVADDNDRVALLTFGFDLGPWLEGGHIDSLRAQSVGDWRQFNPALGLNNPVDPGKPLGSLIAYVESKLPLFDRGDPVLGGLQEGYRHESSWPIFFSKIVEDRAVAPGWNVLDPASRARWIVHQLFRKLPSPGRLYRFWRAGEVFFDELLDRFRELAGAHPNRWRVRRLVLSPDASSRTDGWEDRETYSGRWRDAPIEFLYRGDDGSFVTISNLARCFQKPDAKEDLKAQAIDLVGDDGIVRSVTIESADTAERLGAYSPVLVLDRSPERFRVLVPLESASGCVEAAIDKWRDELGRVWDRMPLRVGIIAFPRMTPLFAVAEAARNVEAVLVRPGHDTWRVAEAHSRNGMTALSLERESGGRETVLLPTTLPDGRPDAFYVYVRVEDRETRHPRDFQHPAGHVYRRALDLRRGDGVIVEPSRVASVFLDTTARRFESVNARPLADFQRMRETWALLVRVAPSLTALRGGWSELTECGAAWRDADGRWLAGGEEQWADLCRAVFAQRLGVSGAALDTLVDAARDGIVGWAIEWHLALLKERLDT